MYSAHVLILRLKLLLLFSWTQRYHNPDRFYFATSCCNTLLEPKWSQRWYKLFSLHRFSLFITTADGCDCKICQSWIYVICYPHKVLLFHFVFCQSLPQESVWLFPAWCFLFAKKLLICIFRDHVGVPEFDAMDESASHSLPASDNPAIFFVFLLWDSPVHQVECHTFLSVFHLLSPPLRRTFRNDCSFNPPTLRSTELLLLKGKAWCFFSSSSIHVSTFKPMIFLPLSPFIFHSRFLSTPPVCISSIFHLLSLFLLFKFWKSLLNCTFFLFLPRTSSHFIFSLFITSSQILVSSNFVLLIMCPCYLVTGSKQM